MDHGGDLTVEDAARLPFDEGTGGVAAFGVEQVRGFPQGGEGVEQIEDLGHLRKRLGQVRPAGSPQRFLAVHEQDDRAHPVGIALRHLLGHPTEDRLHLRRGRVHGIALQGGPYVLEAGPGA